MWHFPALVNALLSIEFVGLVKIFYNNMNEEEH